MCEVLSWRLKPRPLPPTPHKYLYLGSDYRIKGARWLMFHNTNIYQFSKTSTTRFLYLSPGFNYSVKLLFTTLCFVGLYSVPNLIVMLFNLLYLVFIVGFHCKGCVLERERESMKTQATEDWRDFAGSSWLSIPWKEACALHMIGMWRVRPDGDSCVLWVSCR